MEPHKEGLPEQVRTLSTSDLINTLFESTAIDSEVKARGYTFLRDVLSKVDGFPAVGLNACIVTISLHERTIIISVPMSLAQHDVLKAKFNSLPGVARVDRQDLFSDVVLKPDHVPAQSSSQEVAGVRGDVGERVQQL